MLELPKRLHVGINKYGIERNRHSLNFKQRSHAIESLPEYRLAADRF
jgi:hypothetical protein